MNRLNKRWWIARVWRLPQLVGQQIFSLFNLVPSRFRFFVWCALLVISTTILISQFPLSIVPSYRPNDVVRQDIVVPMNLSLAKQLSDADSTMLIDPKRRQQVLLRAGEVVSDEMVPLLEAIRQHQLAKRHPRRLLSLLLLVALIYFALYKASLDNQSGQLESRKIFWVAGTAVLLQAALVRIGLFIAAVLSTRPETMWLGDIFVFQFAIPFAASALLVSMLIGSQLALIVGLISAFLTGLISPLGMVIAGYALASSITAVYSVQRCRTRNAIMQACLTISAVNIVMGLLALLISDHEMSWRIALDVALLGTIGAFLVAAVASFIIPIYESAFSVLTDLKLLELSNAELPLLRQLAIQTPGTNHHSFVVGVLAEAAAKVIGANTLLARVGCLYHDIGKLAAPKMYIENQQGGPNPHDRVSPRDSVRIITGHVRRGIQLAQEMNLPRQIIDFIPQHHGTRVLAFFYHKAKAQAELRGETVNVEDFRYPGPKPQTKEAVILMLADGSEAAARSLDEPTPENIRAIVRKIVDNVIADGQLDECDITFREIMLIRESLINTLIGMYHQRISYPGFNPSGEMKVRGAGLKSQGAAKQAIKSESSVERPRARAHGQR